MCGHAVQPQLPNALQSGRTLSKHLATILPCRRPVQEQQGHLKQELTQARSDCEQARAEAAKKSRKRAKNAVHVGTQCNIGAHPSSASQPSATTTRASWQAAGQTACDPAEQQHAAWNRAGQHKHAQYMQHAAALAPASAGIAMGLPLEESFAAVQCIQTQQAQPHQPHRAPQWQPAPAVLHVQHSAQDATVLAGKQSAAAICAQADAVANSEPPGTQHERSILAKHDDAAHTRHCAPLHAMPSELPSVGGGAQVDVGALAAPDGSSHMSGDENSHADMNNGRLAAVAALQVSCSATVSGSLLRRAATAMMQGAHASD